MPVRVCPSASVVFLETNPISAADCFLKLFLQLDSFTKSLQVRLSCWLLIGLYQSMKQEHLEDQSRSRFNQGIRRALSQGLLISLISDTIIFAMNVSNGVLNSLLDLVVAGGGLSDALKFFISSLLPLMVPIVLFQLPSILVAGMVVMWALSGGPAVLHHYVVRWLLSRRQTFPFRAQAFLNDATSRVLLQRVGGGYSFIHRRLQDYFVATRESDV